MRAARLRQRPAGDGIAAYMKLCRLSIYRPRVLNTQPEQANDSSSRLGPRRTSRNVSRVGRNQPLGAGIAAAMTPVRRPAERHKMRQSPTYAEGRSGWFKEHKDASADQDRIERIDRPEPGRGVMARPTARSRRELLPQRRAHLFQPLQGAEDLRLTVGEMARRVIPPRSCTFSTRQWRRSLIRESAHPLSIGSAGSFAHSPIDPS